MDSVIRSLDGDWAAAMLKVTSDEEPSTTHFSPTAERTSLHTALTRVVPWGTTRVTAWELTPTAVNTSNITQNSTPPRDVHQFSASSS